MGSSFCTRTLIGILQNSLLPPPALPLMPHRQMGLGGNRLNVTFLRIAYVFICFLTVDSFIPTSLLSFLPFFFCPPVCVCLGVDQPGPSEGGGGHELSKVSTQRITGGHHQQCGERQPPSLTSLF